MYNFAFIFFGILFICVLLLFGSVNGIYKLEQIQNTSTVNHMLVEEWTWVEECT